MNIHWKNADRLRLSVLTADGLPATGATGTVTLLWRATREELAAAAALVEVGGGIYRFPLDPALAVSPRDELLAVVEMDAAGEPGYAELPLFVTVPDGSGS